MSRAIARTDTITYTNRYTMAGPPRYAVAVHDKQCLTLSLPAAWVRQRLSEVPFSAAGHWAISGNHSKTRESRTPRYAPVASATRLADVPLPPRHSGKLTRSRPHPTGNCGIAKLPTPWIRSQTRLPEPHNQSNRTSHGYPGSQATVLFDVWILRPSRIPRRAPIFLFPPFKMTSQSGKENVPPVDKVRFGGVTASIFANIVQDVPIPVYKVSITRTYTVKGEFKTVTSFRQEDLPYLNHVLQEAWIRIEQLKQQAWDESRKDDGKRTVETMSERE